MTHRQTTRGRPRPPEGWRRLAVRLPILLFRMGLGPLFGKRLLLLHHTGRVSGLRRQAVLEVVDHDPARGSWTVASGFGPKAAWYQNLLHQPQAVIQFGNRHYAVTAHFLTPEESGDIMARYATEHPRLARRLCAFMSFPVDGSKASFRRAGESIPFARLDAAVGQRLP
jgi:deazaflavin-dependent oxidoreductase (nitroreductase family)